jgi:hypothetical protein
VAAALEVRDLCHPLADLSPAQFCAAWLVRVWDRWPGGRRVQVAQALLEFVEPDSLTVATAQPGLARRAGIGHPRGIARHCAELAAAGLLVARFAEPARRPDDEQQRRYRLRLPAAPGCAAPAAVSGAASGAVPA